MKGKSYGREIDEALKDLEEALNHFKEEAHICSEQRLGRLEQCMLSVKQSLSRLEVNQQEERRTSEGRERNKLTNTEIRRMQATLGVLDKTYRLLASSEVFDARTGGGKPSTLKEKKKIGASFDIGRS